MHHSCMAGAVTGRKIQEIVERDGANPGKSVMGNIGYTVLVVGDVDDKILW
jgi:hypothetical protein